jgi:hypothetical protein
MLIDGSNRYVIGGGGVLEGLVGLRRYRDVVKIRFRASEKSGIHSIVRFGRSGRPELWSFCACNKGEAGFASDCIPRICSQERRLRMNGTRKSRDQTELALDRPNAANFAYPIKHAGSPVASTYFDLVLAEILATFLAITVYKIQHRRGFQLWLTPTASCLLCFQSSIQ